VQVFIEVYPQNASYKTDESRTGHAMRHSVQVPTSGPIDLLLPLVLCGEGGTVGSISGAAVKDGARTRCAGSVAWSLDAYDAVSRPVLGWNIGTASADGSVPRAEPAAGPALPGVADGGGRHRPQDLRGAGADLRGHPAAGVVRPAAGAPAERDAHRHDVRPAAAPEPPSAPTLEQPVVTAGQSATLTGAAEPGRGWSCGRTAAPSTTFRWCAPHRVAERPLHLQRHAADDTRLHVRVAGRDSASAVLGVRHLVADERGSHWRAGVPLQRHGLPRRRGRGAGSRCSRARAAA
jgi:hypothetical protein